MSGTTSSSRIARKARLASFTLIELLVVMTIIAILAALILGAASGVWQKVARSRAASEIQAMSTALESYKTDNGIYPIASGMLTNSAATLYSSSSLDGTMPAYQTNSETLYTALSGQTNFNDIPLSAGKAYMSFKINQLGNANAPANTAQPNSTYVKDPWGYAYCYSTGTTNNAPAPSYPLNGNGFFDLWSTGGLVGGKQTNTAAWISNWQ
jgi:general secretion pathway protein G